jgi:basic membrane protein A and related proteins
MLRRALTVAAALVALPLLAGTVSAAEVKSIAILTPEQGTDFGWNQQAVAGAKAVGQKYGIKVVTAEGLGYGDIRPTLRELAGDGAGLMIAHASGWNKMAPEIAEETKVPVAITDDPAARKPGLVTDYTMSGRDGAYLAGMLAAKMTRTGKLGIVTSGEPPAWNEQSAAFAAGAKSVKPDIKLIYSVIGPAAYGDAAGAKRVTQSVIAAGADIIFGQGDGASFGMIEAVETNKATDGGKVWFIDVIGDKSSIDKGNLLSSVLWNFEPVFGKMVEELKAGTFGKTGYSIGLADGSIALLKTKAIPDAVWADLMKSRDDIIAGKIKVAQVLDAQQVRALMSDVTIGKQ